MGDHDHRAVVADTAQRALYGGLCLVVHGAGGLIKYQDWWVFQQRTGQGQALALAAGEAHAPFTHGGVQALGQGTDERPGLGGFRRLDDLFFAGAGFAVGQVVANAAFKQVHILADQANGIAQGFQADLADGLAVDADLTPFGVVEAQQQFDQGGFAGAGGAHQGERMAGRHVQADAMHAGSAAAIAELDVVETHLAAHRLGQ